MEGAGSDSPQALLATRTDATIDNDDDEEEDFIPAVINAKVSEAAELPKRCPRLRCLGATSFFGRCLSPIEGLQRARVMSIIFTCIEADSFPDM